MLRERGHRYHGAGGSEASGDNMTHRKPYLRRTCGRLMYSAGVPLADISAQLGHADIKTTIRYLGLTVDDLAKAQEKTLNYLEQVRRLGPLVLGRGPKMRVEG